MRKLANATNVIAPGGDYPKGRIKNETTPGVSADGTVVDELVNGDMIQCFQKLVIDAGLTENDLPDNVSNGYQLVEALIALMTAQRGGVLVKKISIGDWNMLANETVVIAHGLTYSKIVGVSSVLIRNDADGTRMSLFGMKDIPATPTGEGGQAVFSTTNLTLYRRATGEFDQATYSSTSYNRGWVFVLYEP